MPFDEGADGLDVDGVEVGHEEDDVRVAHVHRAGKLQVGLVDRADRLNFQDLTDARIPEGGTPGFQTLNVRLGTTLGERRNHTLSLALENIFDQAYRVHGSGVDGPGINAILGYTLRR